MRFPLVSCHQQPCPESWFVCTNLPGGNAADECGARGDTGNLYNVSPADTIVEPGFLGWRRCTSAERDEYRAKYHP